MKIEKKYKNAYLLIIGERAQKNPVSDETLKQIVNHKKIINIPFQINPEEYLAGMDYFILPTYREGFGVVNIEASAMKLPVISTNVPGPQESILDGETGILVPPKQISPLVSAMEKLITDRSYSLKLGNNGRKRVEEYYDQASLWNNILDFQDGLIKQKLYI